MPTDFEFRRSTYAPPATAGSGPGTEVITAIGASGGNFINWTGGFKDTSSEDQFGTPYSNFDAPVIGDDPHPNNFTLYPLKPDLASVEIWFRGFFFGSAGLITNIRLFLTNKDLEGYGQGAQIHGRISDQFPVGDTALVGGVNAAGEAGPNFRAPGAAGGESPSPLEQNQFQNASGFLDLTPGDGATDQTYSRYAVLQLETGSSAKPGEGGRSDFRLRYDES
jgi:hypothetical protein